MELKMQTSLLLIIGTITALAGWMFIYPGDGDGSSGAADNAAALMENPDTARVGMLMGFGGMAAVFAGLLNVSRKMASGGGAGAPYANISGLFAVVLFVLCLFMLGIEWGAAEASSDAIGVDLMQISAASETTFMTSCGLLLLLLGVGIILEKNYHIVIGGFAVISGLAFLSGFAGDSLEVAGFVAWIAMNLVSLAIGIQTLRSKN
ncbi:MAG: hypothetical protein FI734_03750 [SAR202 cluster bacterium]|nr:hypothetical protein [SAR202 cluster bacterium]|tara:strand:+ start:155 stop:772 length:618 start_codon:yes stop_codon:yes gene_type:complete